MSNETSPSPIDPINDPNRIHHDGPPGSQPICNSGKILHNPYQRCCRFWKFHASRLRHFPRRHILRSASAQGPARVPILNYYYVKVVAITTQGGVRLPEWFQAFRPTPTCPRDGLTPQGTRPLPSTPTLDPENRYAGRRAPSKSVCSKKLVSQNAQISIHTNGALEGRVPLHRKAPTGHCIGNPPACDRGTKNRHRTAWHPMLSCATTTRAQSAGHARGARRQRGCRLAARPAALFRTPGCRGGHPTPHPLALAWV